MLLIFFLLPIGLSLAAATFYISPVGNDIYPGTINQPFYTLNKAWSVASAGDIIYMRGGTYRFNSRQDLNNKHCSSGNKLTILNYPGESPVFDFENSTVYIGIIIKDVEFVHIKGIRITNIRRPDNASVGIYGLILIDNVRNCTIEKIETDHIEGTGIAIVGNSNNDLFLNCDSHHNADPNPGGDGVPYGGSDGFWSASPNATDIVFRGCRAWYNSDDGWDLRQANGLFSIDNCWSFWNGFVPDTWDIGGNGDGYKLGGKSSPGTDDILRKVTNSIAFKNLGTGISPEPDNEDEVLGVEMYNCTAYDNAIGWGNGINTGGFNNYTIVKNCIDFSNNGKSAWLQSSAEHSHNSFDLSVSVTSADFLSLNSTGTDGPRQSDGSLPYLNFLRLAKGSDLIDAGEDVGLNYGGNAPDLGAFEVPDDLPPVPAYISATVTDASPGILEINFDLNLNSQSIPVISSFTVKVNSVVKTINAVTISGTKVKLTLKDPIIYGNIVTVSYSKPSVNPLAGTAGGQVLPFDLKPVTNIVKAVNPVYVSSSIENSTPDRVNIFYNLTLAGKIPSSSAFSVLVNSASRTVTAVSVSATMVQLILSSPVKYGDIVLLSYTKPSTNPIQTSTGGIADNLSSKSVTNNCIKKAQTGTKQIIINYPNNVYEGFVNDIEATYVNGKADDSLTLEWSIPSGVTVSTVKSLRTQFLAPLVDYNRTVEFKLKVIDGDTILINEIPITVLPYKPQLSPARISNIEASDYQAPFVPSNILDGDILTKWSSNGDKKWLLLKLSQPFKISFLEIGFLSGQKNESIFDIYASSDKITWDPILTNVMSCSFSGDRQIFDFPSLSGNINYLYLKFIGHGNSSNSQNNISEFKVFGIPNENAMENSKSKISIYPNPANNYLNIYIVEPTMQVDKLRISDTSGKVVFEKIVNPIIRDLQFPLSLNSGIYFVDMSLKNSVIYSQKLVVRN